MTDTWAGKLFVIDGSDASGKETQSTMAVAALQAFGQATSYFDFPQYKTSDGGRLVGECLAGKWGDFVNLDPHIASFPYAWDRREARDAIRGALALGAVICNRYVPSNLAHQGAKYTHWQSSEFGGEKITHFSATMKQIEYIQWLENLEYQQLQLPKPDRVIYLYVPLEVSRALMADKAKDQHERNEQYLQHVISLYSRLARERDDWFIVNCAPNNVMRTRTDIHEEVMSIICSLK